jgi:phage terminase small subunit
MASRPRKAKTKGKTRKARTKKQPPAPTPDLALPPVGAQAIAEIVAAAPPPPAESDPLPLEGAEYRHEVFAQRYVATGNATVASIDAGYSADTAAQQGSRLLKDAKVRRRIGELQQEAIARNGLSRDRIIQELAAVGFSDPTELFFTTPEGTPAIKPIEEWSPAARRAIKSVKVRRVTPTVTAGVYGIVQMPFDILEFAFWDKTSALVKLGENLGMFSKTIKVKHSLDEAAKELHDILGRGFARKQQRESLIAGGQQIQTPGTQPLIVT